MNKLRHPSLKGSIFWGLLVASIIVGPMSVYLHHRYANTFTKEQLCLYMSGQINVSSYYDRGVCYVLFDNEYQPLMVYVAKLRKIVAEHEEFCVAEDVEAIVKRHPGR